MSVISPTVNGVTVKDQHHSMRCTLAKHQRRICREHVAAAAAFKVLQQRSRTYTAVTVTGDEIQLTFAVNSDEQRATTASKYWGMVHISV